MTKLKICFLTTSLSTGGIEMYLLRFLRYLEKDKYEITVIVRSLKKGELEEDYGNLGINVIRLPLGYLRLRRMWKYYRLFKRESYDVICDFNANFAGIPMLLGRMAGIKRRIVFYRQGKDHFSSTRLKNKFNALLNNLVYRESTHILSNSQAALDYFFSNRYKKDNRFQVIRNGVNIAEYQIEESKNSIREELGLPKRAFIIGHVGRLDPAKNHSTILQVFQQVKRIVPEAHLVLCGRDTNSLQDDLQKMGLQSGTTIWEYRKDIPRVLKSLDCFLFPSLTEGQPNALIEAMVAGVSIVASDIPAIKECIPEKHWDQLTNPKDVEGMGSKIMNIYGQQPNTVWIQELVSAQFNADKNFSIFEEILVNG